MTALFVFIQIVRNRFMASDWNVLSQNSLDVCRNFRKLGGLVISQFDGQNKQVGNRTSNHESLI